MEKEDIQRREEDCVRSIEEKRRLGGIKERQIRGLKERLEQERKGGSRTPKAE